MGLFLTLTGSTISEYITALPGLLSHVAMEVSGEALIEFGPWLVIVLIWRNPLIAMGALVAIGLVCGLTSILAETLSGEWNSRPRSLFSYESENRRSSE